MTASIHEHKSPPATPDSEGIPRPPQSAFKGEARLRELEHLADTARKIRNQAAAELTRGSGATHHVARERIAVAERMLRKSEQEIAELRAQLPFAGSTAMTANDVELAILLGHNRGRFSQVGGVHQTLELQQEIAVKRSSPPPAARRHKPLPAAHANTVRTHRTIGVLIIIGLMLGTLGALATLKQNFVEDATQFVREGTDQLSIRIRALLPSSDAHTQVITKKPLARNEDAPRKHPI